MTSIPLAEQIKCVKREIAMRERVYPRWVNAGRLVQSKADTEIAVMKAVLKTLETQPLPLLHPEERAPGARHEGAPRHEGPPEEPRDAQS